MKLTIIQQKIFEVRGQKVMLDFDLAKLYGVETRRLSEQVKRNAERFPKDFMFQLTRQELKLLKGLGLRNKYMRFITLHIAIIIKEVLLKPNPFYE